MHRDIKPSNVLVTVEGLKMGDLGLGRQFSSQTNEAFSKVACLFLVEVVFQRLGRLQIAPIRNASGYFGVWCRYCYRAI